MKHSKLLQGIFAALGIVLILFVGAKARNAIEEYTYIGRAIRDRDTITITGEGKVTAKPDLARMDLGVQTDALTVSQAQRENTKKMNEILAALKQLGVKTEDMQTAHYSIFPKQEWKEGKSTIIGYTVAQNVSVKVRNLDHVGEVLAKAGELGANQVGGIQFTIDEPQKLQDNARGKAIEDARKKAHVLAKQLGLDIVKVVTFSEHAGSQPLPIYTRAMPAAMLMEAAPAPTIEPGSLDVTANLSVTFEVR